MKSLHRPLLALALVALGGLSLGASCSKNSASPDESGETATPEKSGAKNGDSASAAKPVDVDVPGVDTKDMEKSQKLRFSKLLDSLNSPCGEAQSLRTAATGSDCARGRFAARYTAELIKDGAADSEVRELYKLAYGGKNERETIAVDAAAPHVGPTDARVKIVEYYDYGCPACKHFAPLLDKAAAEFPRDVVVYYKQFPLASHVDSPGAAQAALAAHKQGKFKEMHKLLFANQMKHKKSDLDGYAKLLGLDMNKFQADYQAAKALVEADKTAGAKLVQGTPTLFINGRKYEGPGVYKYLKMWIEEELAVNQ